MLKTAGEQNQHIYFHKHLLLLHYMKTQKNLKKNAMSVLIFKHQTKRL